MAGNFPGSAAALDSWRIRHLRSRVVATNGCFDVLHVGHLRCLQYAASQGDVLIVGLNSDRSVRELKGKGRPVNGEADRAEMLLGLRCVDAVYIFDTVNAAAFIDGASPDLYVKGGDYTLEKLEANERNALQRRRARIEFFPLVGGKSTSRICQALLNHS